MAANANATASSDEAAKARAAEQAILADVAARLNRALYLLEKARLGLVTSLQLRSVGLDGQPGQVTPAGTATSVTEALADAVQDITGAAFVLTEEVDREGQVS